MVFNEEYQYDANGNKTYADENGKITKYSYDGLNRISSVTENGYDITQYEYDGYNNISKEYTFNNTGINTKKYFYDANNRLILSETEDNYITYDYDNAGNQTKKTDNGRTEYYSYDGYNRLNSYYDGYNQAEYAYNLSGLRKSKTVNGKMTRFVYSGADIIGEITNDNYYVYYRGTELLGSKSYSGGVNFYRLDGHGSVTAVLSPTGEELKTYNYDAFGAKKAFIIPPMGENTILFQWKAETDGIHNPFGYCGEYTDTETGLIYLRNRYYSPTTGRFITEDPIRDGLNWYAYCENNPVMFVDYFGLFDYDDILSTSTEYNIDVKVMQNELAWLGYYSGEIDGYFGQKTLDAVNAYKNDVGLWNFGEYEGVVGLTTWTSLGLIYRTQEDINAGVNITTIGCKQYFDITKPVTNAVYKSIDEFSQHSQDLDWFRKTVGDTGKWNVKRNPDVWSATLGVSKNSYNKTLLFYGRVLKIDDIGNITYGYLGKVANISDTLLKLGSMGNHIKNHGLGDFDNEFTDEAYIQLGINWYNGADIQVRYGIQ